MSKFRRGPYVTLRPVTEADIPYMVEYLNDPEVSVNLTVYRPVSEAAERAFIERANKADCADIILALEVDGVFIGTMGVHGIDHRHGIATTGTVIGKKYQGKGYASEAKMLLLEYAFNTLNLRKVYSNVHSFNDYSLRYAAKCGYKEEGRLKAHHYAKGQYWDRVQLAVFREDFWPLWERFALEHKDSLMTES